MIDMHNISQGDPANRIPCCAKENNVFLSTEISSITVPSERRRGWLRGGGGVTLTCFSHQRKKKNDSGFASRNISSGFQACSCSDCSLNQVQRRHTHTLLINQRRCSVNVNTIEIWATLYNNSTYDSIKMIILVDGSRQSNV